MLNVNVECPTSACLVRMIWVKDQHAQAQQWLMHAQAQAQAQHWIMHALSLSGLASKEAATRTFNIDIQH